MKKRRISSRRGLVVSGYGMMGLASSGFPAVLKTNVPAGITTVPFGADFAGAVRSTFVTSLG